MPDSEFFLLCKGWVERGLQPVEFTNELYAVIDAALAKFRIGEIHGEAISDEVRQDCTVKLFSYTIRKMVKASAGVASLNAHSYIYFAAYNEVGQFLRKYYRRKGLGADVDVMNELLDIVAYDGTKRIVTRNEEDDDADGTEAEERDDLGEPWEPCCCEWSDEGL